METARGPKSCTVGAFRPECKRVKDSWMQKTTCHLPPSTWVVPSPLKGWHREAFQVFIRGGTVDAASMRCRFCVVKDTIKCTSCSGVEAPEQGGASGLLFACLWVARRHPGQITCNITVPRWRLQEGQSRVLSARFVPNASVPRADKGWHHAACQVLIRRGTGRAGRKKDR